MAKRGSVGPDSEEAVKEAVQYAERYAAESGESFLDVLNRSYWETAEKAGQKGRARTAAGTVANVSLELDKDARYLENARALAHRTLGGARILGGRPVKRGEFLDCVAVGSDTEWGCTGTLVGPNTVVTAGHCRDCATRIFIGDDVKKKGRVVAVAKRIRHPEYRAGGHENDLMVLLLETPVEDVDPRRIAAPPLIDAAGDGRAVGFGNVDPRGLFGYGIKRLVDLPIASPACRGSVAGTADSMSYGCDAGLEIVAGRPLLERDSCRGDSGGPFYVQDENGEWLLAGATSRATKSAMSTCGDGGIYVRVDAYRDWIEGIDGARLA